MIHDTLVNRLLHTATAISRQDMIPWSKGVTQDAVAALAPALLVGLSVSFQCLYRFKFDVFHGVC